MIIVFVTRNTILLCWWWWLWCYFRRNINYFNYYCYYSKYNEILFNWTPKWNHSTQEYIYFFGLWRRCNSPSKKFVTFEKKKSPNKSGQPHLFSSNSWLVSKTTVAVLLLLLLLLLRLLILSKLRKKKKKINPSLINCMLRNAFRSGFYTNTHTHKKN